MTSASAAMPSVRSLVPARMDRLPWTRFHWRVILGLGSAWILDGLEEIATPLSAVSRQSGEPTQA
jgi:hypothetical protein